MHLQNRNEESGQSRLRVLIILAIVIVVAYGAYKLIPSLWHGWHTFSYGLKVWWHVRVADPIFKGLIYLLLATRGQALAALAAIAFAYWLLGRIVGAISTLGFRKMAKQPQILQETIIGQMENVHVKLKRLFADDIEKIALFGGRISSDQSEPVSGNPLYVGCLVFLPGIVWIAFAIPVMTMIGVAVYDGVLRLFVTPESVNSLLAAAGSNADNLRAILPIHPSLSLGIFTVNLSDRSMALAAILCAVGLLNWGVTSISASGWTLPRLATPFPVLTFMLVIVISYLILNSALLIFAISTVTYSLIYNILTRCLFRPLSLRAKAIIAPRSRAKERPIEEPAPAAA
ncbi:MAG TPA: hypothetical protein VGJ55_19090 [Pyrinomonadaceae bacterium]